jgi:hypothetical protein
MSYRLWPLVGLPLFQLPDTPPDKDGRERDDKKVA